MWAGAVDPDSSPSPSPNSNPREQQPYAYNPAGLDLTNGQYGSTTHFGTSRPLEEIITIISSKGHTDAATKEQKRQIHGDTGVFYYNHDRLIELMKLPKQNEAYTGSIYPNPHPNPHPNPKP